jgi:ABC-type multidrug transport system permease subunit
MNNIYRNQLVQLTNSYIKELIREPAVLFWGILFPILMAWGLGIAFTKQGDVIRTVAIVKHNDLLYKPGNSILYDFLAKNAARKNGNYAITISNKKLGKITYIFKECEWHEAYTLLKKGNIAIIVEDFGKYVNYHFDPASSEAQMVFQQISGMLTTGVKFFASHEDEIKPLTITGTRYVDFLVPGLLSMGIMMSTMWGISYTIIERRSKKLLRRMVATPLKKSNFLIALIIARFIMNVIEALLLFVFSWLYFGTCIQGNLFALLAVFIAGNIAFSGIAVLISSHTSNPEVGNGLINAIVTPMMVISGIFVSYHNFPDWTLPVIRNLPLTMLADCVRSIFNEGAGFAQIWFDILVLLLTGSISFVIGLKVFKWY